MKLDKAGISRVRQRVRPSAIPPRRTFVLGVFLARILENNYAVLPRDIASRNVCVVRSSKIKVGQSSIARPSRQSIFAKRL